MRTVTFKKDIPLRRRQLIEDGNWEIGDRDLPEG